MSENDLVERLRRPTARTANSEFGPAYENPDGPEAAALIEEMVEALDALVEAVMDDDPSGAFAIAKHSGRAIIAKAKGAA